ncbi:hypothetical protein RJ639_024115 [Escallonia herrerae]|uniref:Reverse transcriptase Ty1/copia-type domain-containing protein n=1 Tax=Escallonia herrerae TaxID=1293975 RepID=A0AA89ACQ7_9ASTE|nr:hypothetical protein RJ639_024115 [Escallonia herrerae]
MALTDDFESIHASLLHRSPFPTLEAAISDLLYEETRLGSLKSQRTDAVLAIFASRLSKGIFQILVRSGANIVMSPLCELGLDLHFTSSGCSVHDPRTGQILGIGRKNFLMKELGVLSYFLGLEISSSVDGYTLSQAKYASDLLSRVRLTDSKTAPTPLEPNFKLAPFDGSPLPDVTLY